MTTITARELNQDVSAAKRAAANGPVVVTDRGRPAFVLMTYAEFEQRWARDAPNPLARIAMDEEDFVDDDAFSPQPVRVDVPEL